MVKRRRSKEGNPRIGRATVDVNRAANLTENSVRDIN